MANVTMATLMASEMRLGSIHMGGTAGPGILRDRRDQSITHPSPLDGCGQTIEFYTFRNTMAFCRFHVFHSNIPDFKAFRNNGRLKSLPNPNHFYLGVKM